MLANSGILLVCARCEPASIPLTTTNSPLNLATAWGCLKEMPVPDEQKLPKRTTNINMRVHPEVRLQLAELAAQHDRFLSGMAAIILSRGLTALTEEISLHEEQL